MKLSTNILQQVPSLEVGPKKSIQNQNNVEQTCKSNPDFHPIEPLSGLIGGTDPKIYKWKTMLLVYTICIYAFTYQAVLNLFGDCNFTEIVLVLCPSIILLILLSITKTLLVKMATQNPNYHLLDVSLNIIFRQFVFGHCLASFLRLLIMVLFDPINKRVLLGSYWMPILELYALVSALYYYTYLEISMRCLAICECAFKPNTLTTKPIANNEIIVV